MGAELARVPNTPLVPGAGQEVGPSRRAAALLDEAMTETAREAWPPIGEADMETSLAAGELAHARAWADSRAPVAAVAERAALDAVADATERAVAVARLGPRHEPGRAPWGRAGLVIPVLGATNGVGVSVVAAALFDALDAAGVRTLLVDAADPQRSGLAAAARNQGVASRTLHPDVGVAFARRGDGWMAQMAITHGAVMSASMVPAPAWWLPEDEASAPEVTVVDLGWDPWAMAAAPLRGPGAWLEAGSPLPRPVLVVAPTRPGLAQANQLLERLRPWTDHGRVASPAGLAVVGARRWPRDVPGVAARALGPLTSDAVFVPNDAETRTAGVGPRPLSPRLQRAVTPLLAGLNVVPATGRAPKRHSVTHQAAYRRTRP